MNNNEALIAAAYRHETAETDRVLAKIIGELMVTVAPEVHASRGRGSSPMGFNRRDSVSDILNLPQVDNTRQFGHHPLLQSTSYKGILLPNSETDEVESYGIVMVAEMPGYDTAKQEHLRIRAKEVNSYSPNGALSKRFRKRGQDRLRETLMQDADRFHIRVGHICLLDVENPFRDDDTEGAPGVNRRPYDLSNKVFSTDLKSAVEEATAIGKARQDKSATAISLLEQVPRH